MRQTCLHFLKEHTDEHVPSATLKVHGHVLVYFWYCTFIILHCEPLMARKLLSDTVSTTKVISFVGDRSVRGDLGPFGIES